MRVPWIRVHGALIDRPVVTRLAESLRLSDHEAIGLLVTFWSGVASHAENGLIRDYPDAQLEKWAHWRRKRGAFAKWVRGNHMDADGRVPEWDDYAGELEYQRARNREHQKAHRDRLRKADVRLTSPTTVRDGTEREEKERKGSSDDDSAQQFRDEVNERLIHRFRSGPDLIPGFPLALCVRFLADLAQNGVPADFATTDAVWQIGKARQPPANLAYFREGILTRWGEAQKRPAARNGSPESVVSILSRGRA